MAKEKDGEYYSLHDGSGSGQDHCEAVGSSSDGSLGPTKGGTDNGGFWRHTRGTQFQFAETRNGNYYTAQYYTCSGVDVSGSGWTCDDIATAKPCPVDASFATNSDYACSGKMCKRKTKFQGFFVGVTACSSGTDHYKVRAMPSHTAPP